MRYRAVTFIRLHCSVTWWLYRPGRC